MIAVCFFALLAIVIAVLLTGAALEEWKYFNDNKFTLCVLIFAAGLWDVMVLISLWETIRSFFHPT